MPPPYSAGSVFLQVVPSFAEIQQDVRKNARKVGKDYGDEFDAGFREATGKGLSEAIADGLKKADASAEKSGERAGRAFSKGMNKTAGAAVEKQITKAMDGAADAGAANAGKKAGEKYAGQFADTLKKAVSKAQREVETLKIGANGDEALAEIKSVQAALKALAKAKIDVNLDAKDAVEEVARLEAILFAMQRDAKSIRVRVNAAAAMTELATVKAMIEQLNKMSIGPKADARQLGSFETLLRSKIESALKAIPPVDIKGNPGPINRTIDKIRADLASVASADVGVNMTSTEALTKLRALMAELAKLDAADTDVAVRVDVAAAYRELAAIFAVIEALEADDVKIDVNVNENGAAGTLGRVGGAAKRAGADGQDGANAFRAFNGVLFTAVTLGPALVPILGAIGGGLLAVGTFGVAAAAGLAVTALGFSGISDSVKALSDVDKNAAKDTAAAAKTMRSAANSVRDARRGVAQAAQDADDARISSGRRVDDALRRQADAEDNLLDAQKDRTKAVKELSRAQKEASEQAEELALRARGGVIAERAAALSLAKAQVAYIQTFQDGSSTNVEREEAAIALEQEKLGYDEAVLANRRLKEQKAETDAAGVQGAEQVVAANERVASANEAIEDAASGVEDAQRDVAEAQEDAARAQRDSAQQIAQANERLVDAQISYQEALYDTSVIGSESNRKLEESFGRLGPAGQEFATFIYSLRDEFEQLRLVAQEGLLPGVQDGIEAFMSSSGGALLEFVGVVATSVGDLFRRAGEAFGSPEWQRFFDLMTVYTPIFIDQFGTIFGNIIEGIANVIMALFPFTEDFGGGLEDVTQSWVDMTAGFSDPDSGFQGFLNWVRDIGPDVMAFLGAFVGAMGNLFVALEPLGGLILTGVTDFLQFIANMDPEVLESITVALLGIVGASQLVFGISALVSAATTVFASTFGIILFVVAAIVVGLYLLYTNSETARAIIDDVFHVIGEVATWLFDEVLKPYFEYAVWLWTNIATGIAWAWENILKPVFLFIGEVVTWLWTNILEPIFSVWGRIFGVVMDLLALAWREVGQPIFELIASVAQSVWGVLEPIFTLAAMAFRTLWSLVAWAWENIGAPVFNWVMELIADTWENVIGPVFGFIIEAFGNVVDFFASAWATVGAPVFELIESIFDALVGVFQGNFDAIKGIWDALMGVFLAPIRFVVETVLNNGLIAGINHIAGIFTDDPTWIDPIPTGWLNTAQDAISINRAFGGPIPEANGRVAGYSPNKRADNIPLWATAGEYMHDVDAVQFWGLDFMEDINARRLPRVFADAQMRAYGGLIDPMWGRIQQQFPQARLTSHYRPGDPGNHGKKKAIDIGGRIPYPNATGVNDMLAINQWIAQQYGTVALELIHSGRGGINLYRGQPHRYNAATVADHYDHVHWAMNSLADIAAGGGSLAGASATGLMGDVDDPWYQKAWDFLASPVEFLRGLITDAAGSSLTSKIGELLIEVPFDLASGIADSLVDLAGDTWDALTGGGNELVGRPIQGADAGSGDVRAVVQAAAAQRGWGTGGQWDAISWIINKESGWNPNAQNPVSTASGLFQHINGTWNAYKPPGVTAGRMRDATVAQQAQAGMNYLAGRYGTPNQARQFWMANNYYADGGLVDGGGHGEAPTPVHAQLYDEGGYLPPGLTMVLNATGKPEPVLTAAELDLMRDGGGGVSAGDTWDVDIHESSADSEQLVGTLMHRVKVIKRGGKYNRTRG